MSERPTMEHHLAQLNIARMMAPLDDPLMKRFVERIEPINRLAYESPGFIWRLQTDEGDATSVRAFGDAPMLVNVSVWKSVEALKAYVFNTDHVQVMRERAQWFEPMNTPTTVLWWILKDQIPTIEEAKKRLKLLEENGPCEDAFSFSRPFPMPDSSTPVVFRANDMRQANESDVGDIIDLLEESSAWMISIGIDRWQPGTHAAEEQELRREVNSETVYVWKPNNVISGTIRLTESDDAIWPNDSIGALYIHKMSVRRALKGYGLGKELLQWAEQQAILRGLDRLRLDCWAENPPLCKFYENCGFQRIRTTTVQGWSHQLFERRIRQGSSLAGGQKA